MIYAFAIFATTLAIDLITDVRRYYARKPINHARGVALRLVGLVPACILGGWKFIPFCLIAYWILFNGLYNIFIGQKWFYKGETAKLDQLERKHPWIVPVKYLLLIISIVLLCS